MPNSKTNIDLNSRENSAIVRLYTPKGAALAMLSGKVLKDTDGARHYWDPGMEDFRYEEEGGYPAITCFKGLFEEAEYA